LYEFFEHLEDTDVERLWARNDKIKNGIPIGTAYASKDQVMGKNFEEEFPSLGGDNLQRK
jgi:hypothetical protein